MYKCRGDDPTMADDYFEYTDITAMSYNGRGESARIIIPNWGYVSVFSGALTRFYAKCYDYNIIIIYFMALWFGRLRVLISFFFSISCLMGVMVKLLW